METGTSFRDGLMPWIISKETSVSPSTNGAERMAAGHDITACQAPSIRSQFWAWAATKAPPRANTRRRTVVRFVAIVGWVPGGRLRHRGLRKGDSNLGANAMTIVRLAAVVA